MKKELVSYIVFGLLTTVVNFAVFYLLTSTMQIDYRIANTIAWFLSVGFAYFTNKRFVFSSKQDNVLYVLREGLSFFAFRFLSYLLDMALIITLIQFLNINSLISKAIVNIFVILFNYISSKFFTFKRYSYLNKE